MIKDTIYKMMMTSTGTALLDSGFGERGRAWQRNQIDYPTLESIEQSPIIVIEKPEQWYTLKDAENQFIRRFKSESEAFEYIKGDTRTYPIEKETLDSTDVDYTVSLYHYLVDALEVDELCEKFNALECKDWDSDKACGISKTQEEWLEKQGFVIGNTWNSYNSESNLSQTIQGANITVDDEAEEYPTYILLQIHQGADVRGGYTDAKLFKVTREYFTTNPDIYGDIDDVSVSNTYDGYNLLSNDDESQGEIVPMTPDSVINLYLGEY